MCGSQSQQSSKSQKSVQKQDVINTNQVKLEESGEMKWNAPEQDNIIKTSADEDIQDAKKAKASLLQNMPAEYTPELSKEIRGSRAVYKDAYQLLDESTFRQEVFTWHPTYDSESMMRVKNAYRRLNQMFATPIDLEKETPNNVAVDLHNAYAEVKNAANAYIGCHRHVLTIEGNARLRHVREIRDSCDKEMTQLRPAVQRALRVVLDAKEKGIHRTMFYRDVLRYCRTEEINKPLIRKGGGNNSTVFDIEGDDRMFKKAERTVQFSYASTIKAIKDISGEIKKKPDGSPDREGRMISDFAESFVEYLDDYLKVQEVNNERTLSERIMRVISSENEDKLRSNMENLLELFSFNGELDKEGRALKKNLDELMDYFLGQEIGDMDDEFDVYASSAEARGTMFADAMKKCYYGRLKGTLIAQYNEIHDTADLASRNVAMSRMCTKVLGFQSNIITQSENASVKAEGDRTMDGILMEKAKGCSLDELKKRHRMRDAKQYLGRKDCRITPQAAQQLIQLQLLDMICGQCDRHGNNIFAQFDEKALAERNELVITGVTGIDNDMCLGNLPPQYLLEGFNRMSFLCRKETKDDASELAFRHLDRDTFNRIMNIDFDYMENQLADLGITNREMDALKDRIHLIQMYLRDAAEKNENFILKGENPYLQVGSLNEVYNSQNAARKGNGDLKDSLVLYMEVFTDRIAV